LAGFALAGSGTGRSDLFQANLICGMRWDLLMSQRPDITINRTVTAADADQLRAEFNANTFSGRLESGYRLVAAWAGGIGITPYAASQFTTSDLSAYAEQVISGAGSFALAYNARDVTDARSELSYRQIIRRIGWHSHAARSPRLGP
jgi:uncharacterized protein YhjY with autotransporter beta-barrel domain